MISALPPDIAELYRREDTMVRPKSQWPSDMASLCRRYSRVMGPRTEWLRYLHRPEVRDLWRLAPLSERKLPMGIATVAKKDGHTLRKVLQSVPFNSASYTLGEMLGEEFDYGLQGGAALAQLSFPAATREWHALSLDESNAFTHVITPSWWWPYMCGPPVLSNELPPAWEDGRWKRGVWVVPMYTRLGMGHSHSAFILLVINFGAIRRAIASSVDFVKTVVLNFRQERRRRVRMLDDVMAVYVHVDDCGVFGLCRGLVDRLRMAIRAELEALGFYLTEDDIMATGRYVGLAAQQSPPCWLPALIKLGHLYRLFDELLEAGYVDVSTVHTALSIFV